MYKTSRGTIALFLLTSGIVVSLLVGYSNEYTGIASEYGVKLAQDFLSSPIRTAAARTNTSSIAGWNDALQSCRMTDLPNDPLVKEYGQNNIRLSRTYEGSGTRIRRVMEKALRGEKIKIAVVGGSVSAGHAVPWPWTAESHMYKRIQKWFEDTFPGAKHSLNLDSTVPAVSAWYFSYCVLATLPEDADLVFLELDINQWPPEDRGVLENTERLFRTILDLPSKPALVYLSVFGLVFNDMTFGWRSSSILSQWLDVPEISLRNWYLPHLMKNPDVMPYLFQAPQGHMDKRHMNGQGHRALADMTIGYLREQLCLAQRSGPVEQEPEVPQWPGNYITQELPRLMMISKWSENGSIPLLHPRCETVSSKTMPLTPMHMQGWELVNRNDKKSYESTEPGSIITFKVNVIEGQVGLFVWKTPKEGFGDIICWIDGDEREVSKKVAKSLTKRVAATFEHTGDMFKGLTPGEHVLTCRSKTSKEGGNIFRISATVAR